MAEEKIQWFAARTRDKQELAIGKKLQKLEVIYFLPTRREIRQLKDRRKEVEVPVIRNLIFVRATKQRAIDLHNKDGIALFYLTDLSKRGMLVVPDKQMDDFIQVMNLKPESVSFDGERLMPGDKVRVIKGDLCGVEGEVTTDVNTTYLLIRIHGVLTATVKVAKSYLRVLKNS